jgi:molybdate transport system substrate-binding protein
VDVKLVFAGSQVLRLQLEQGASADLFASANEQHMAALTAAGVINGSTTFAFNELVLIVPADNPAGIESFADLPRASRLVIGADNVPVGIYARRLLDRARARYGAKFARRVRSRVVSKESNVRLVRAKVELGEADAAIVYRTDAASTDRVRVVAIPPELNVRATYPLGQVATSTAAELAKQFTNYVTSAKGRELLENRGFVTAP